MPLPILLFIAALGVLTNFLAVTYSLEEPAIIRLDVRYPIRSR